MATLYSICFNDEAFIVKYTSLSIDLCLTHLFAVPGQYGTLPVGGKWFYTILGSCVFIHCVVALCNFC